MTALESWSPGRCANLAPEAAALHIGSMHRLWTHLGHLFECQQMECCWAIFHGADEAEAARLLLAHTPLAPAAARRYAAAWEAARKNRGLMAAAVDRPVEAVRFVSDLADADIDAADVGGVAQILALPPRRRAQRVAELVDAERAAQARRDPADARRIEDLEREIAEITAERGRRVSQRDLAGLLTAAEDKLAEAAEAIRAQGLTAPARERLTLLVDGVMAAAESVVDAMTGLGA